MNNAKKGRQTIEWGRLEISSGNEKMPREEKISCKDGHNKDRNVMYLTETKDFKKWQ